MRSKFLLFFLFCTSLILSASQLLDLYHKNYGMIERTVLVFDQLPKYIIEENADNVRLTIFKTSIKPEIKSFPVKEDRVITCYEISPLAGDLIITLKLNRESFLSASPAYRLENFHLKEQAWKLVLDIFLITDPVSAGEHQAYADFFRIVGFRDRAAAHLALADSLRQSAELIIPASASDTAPDTIPSTRPEAEERLDKISIRQRFAMLNDQFRRINPLFWLLPLLIILIIVLLIILRARTNQVKPLPGSRSYRSHEGFGSPELQRKIALILKKKGWELEDIAREMMLKTEDVKSLLKKNQSSDD